MTDKKEEITIGKPRYSMNGWKFMEWLKGNWTTLKELVKVGVPLLVGTTFFMDKPALVVFITGLGKLGLDTVDYWLSIQHK